MPNFSRKVTCCFAGYRPAKLPWGEDENDSRCVELKRKLYDFVEAVYLSGVRHFICGMAIGCDLLFCQAVLKLKTVYPDVTLEAAIPFPGQANAWPEWSRRKYEYLVGCCDYISTLSKKYTDDCMRVRNKYMVDRSSVLIAVYDGKRGGTMMTVNYARRNGLEIIQIAP
jgi:uncharacterized phage-like protein YoqJ